MATVASFVTRLRALLRNPATMTQSNYETTDLVFYLQMAIRDAEIELSALDANWNVTEGNVTLVDGTHTYPWPQSNDLFRAVLLVEYNFGGRRYPILPLEGGWQSAAEYSTPTPVNPQGTGYRYLPLQVGATAKFRLFPTPNESSTSALVVTYEKSVIPNGGFDITGSDTLDVPTEWAEWAIWQAASYATMQDEENPGYYSGQADRRLQKLKMAYHYRKKGAGQPRKVLLDDGY